MLNFNNNDNDFTPKSTQNFPCNLNKYIPQYK